MVFPTPEHIKAAQDAADQVKAKTGFYCWPSVTLAQALIESAGWTKLSGKNNGFGIKATLAERNAGRATKRTTREVANGKSIYIDDWFADYDSIEEAYEAHALLFTRVSVYKPGLVAKNAEAFIDAIAPHYATDPTYALTLKGICRRSGLYQYDQPASVSIPDVPVPKPTPAPAPLPWWKRWFLALFSKQVS